MRTIEQVVSYEDGYNLYSMDVKYDYDVERVIRRGVTDDQSVVDAIRKEVDARLAVAFTMA